MVPNVLRNLVSKPATRLYPAVRREPFAGSRGQLIVDEERCCYCGSCARVCPAAAIVIRGSRKEKDVRIGYNPFTCIYCGRCVEICPCCAVVMSNYHTSPAYEKAEVFRESEPC
jgi:ech hydrogenase subunit F